MRRLSDAGYRTPRRRRSTRWVRPGRHGMLSHPRGIVELVRCDDCDDCDAELVELTPTTLEMTSQVRRYQCDECGTRWVRDVGGTLLPEE